MLRKNTCAALALGLVVSTLTTPSFAQRSDDQMSTSRQDALRDCNHKKPQSQHTWGDHQMDFYRACMMQHGEQE